jgi:hypothetical protein
MSAIRSGYMAGDHEHFHPDDTDPAKQRRLRGLLEQIDYTTFACNREVIGKLIGRVGPKAFQTLALATAQARAAWVAAALAAAQVQPTSPEAVRELTRLRQAFEELRDAYDAARRMVERGYLAYDPLAKT